jgi:Holliday junction resolvase-like predicted endonuclease
MNNNNIQTGKLGEALAAAYLQNMGYTLLDLNWRHHHWELDIIAANANTLHFVEVKSGNAFLMDKQKNIKTAILEKRVHWHEISIEGNTED